MEGAEDDRTARKNIFDSHFRSGNRQSEIYCAPDAQNHLHFPRQLFGAVIGLVLLVAAVSISVPAARAARTDPMRVLREE
jgi:hypothetical protein